jgi:DNA-binding FadR family transcriptional regulator
MSLSDNDTTIKQLTALPRKRLTDHAVSAIQDYIISANLQTDDKLPSENELAQLLGVSRNVVRQALSSLEAVGIVRIEQGRGTFVAGLGAAAKVLENLAVWLDVENLDTHSYAEIRHALECGVLQLVMQKAREEDFDRLDELVREMEQLPLDQRMLRNPCHEAYHKILLGATQNQFLASLAFVIQNFFFWLYANAPQVRHIPPEDFAAVHRVLTDGLRQRDESFIPYLISVHVGATPLEKDT